jgi:hypothetical protein
MKFCTTSRSRSLQPVAGVFDEPYSQLGASKLPLLTLYTRIEAGHVKCWTYKDGKGPMDHIYVSHIILLVDEILHVC